MKRTIRTRSRGPKDVENDEKEVVEQKENGAKRKKIVSFCEKKTKQK